MCRSHEGALLDIFIFGKIRLLTTSIKLTTYEMTHHGHFELFSTLRHSPVKWVKTQNTSTVETKMTLLSQ